MNKDDIKEVIGDNDMIIVLECKNGDIKSLSYGKDEKYCSIASTFVDIIFRVLGIKEEEKGGERK